MAERTGKRRTYRSPHRREQAEETRERLLAAARRLFVERGFAGTTVVAIAEAGGTAVETVYAIFRTKLAILEALVLAGARGVPSPADSRASANPLDRITEFAEETAQRLDEAGPLMAVVAGAAKGEPRLAALLETYQLDRRRASRGFVDSLSGGGRLRLEREEAVDALWAVASPEIHGLLTGIRGWSRGRYKTWLAESLSTLLIGTR